MRAACKASEQRLDPATLGLQGPAGVSGYEIVSGTPQVVDREHQWVIAIQKPDGALFLAEEGVSGTVFAICASVQ